VRSPAEKVRLQLERRVVRESECSRVLRGSLAMGAERSRVHGGCGSEAQNRRGVRCRLRVMGHPGKIGSSRRRIDQRPEGRLVQAAPPIRRQRLLHRQAGELVPKRDACPSRDEHAGCEALLEPIDRAAGERLQ
jgi:hypothetical protein